MSSQHVMVIGGGVIGTACAYYLSRSGQRVTILDQGRFGSGCSHGNCGLICASHVLPMAAPGAIKKSLLAVLQRNSPLRIKARWDRSLWKWLLRFSRCCNRQQMLDAGRARHALLSQSLALYRQLLQDEPIDCEWESRGLLHVFLDPLQFERYAETVRLVNEQYGISATRYGHTEVLDLEPTLKPSVAGGWHFPSDAHLRPDKLLATWRSVLATAGVEIIENCVVSSLVATDGRARAVCTAMGEKTADCFVVATGAWTPRFARQLGCPIPIQPGKGYSITMSRPDPCPAVPMIFDQHRVAVTPMKSGFRLGSTMEFCGYDPSISDRRLVLLTEGASHYLSPSGDEPVEPPWYGWRPMTYDGVPLIDRSPAMHNVYLAVGHNMVGISTAPATGQLIAQMVNGQPTQIDPVPYSVGRF